jgi:hypothetical protein
MLKKHSCKISLIVLIGFFFLSFQGYAFAAKKEIKADGVYFDGEFVADKETHLKAVKEGKLQFYTAHTLGQVTVLYGSYIVSGKENGCSIHGEFPGD